MTDAMTTGGDDGAVTPALSVTDQLWESRVMLKPRDPRALRSILGADMRHSDAQFAHKMIWTLFPGMPDAQRSGLFLFHVEHDQPFTAIIRSRRPPEDGLGGIWCIERTRPFQPMLRPEQRLRFRVRAVASRWEPRPGKKRGHRVDVVRFAWNRLPEAERSPEMLEATAHAAAFDWLVGQGARCGFRMLAEEVAVLDYDITSLSPDGRRRDRSRNIQFGALTYEGLLTVTEPEAFRQMLVSGLGSGRAYGNGLMQIAPAP
jgi:CRISPR system Cascade subunit CasE